MRCFSFNECATNDVHHELNTPELPPLPLVGYFASGSSLVNFLSWEFYPLWLPLGDLLSSIIHQVDYVLNSPHWSDVFLAGNGGLPNFIGKSCFSFYVNFLNWTLLLKRYQNAAGKQTKEK